MFTYFRDSTLGRGFLEVLFVAREIFGKRTFRLRGTKGKWELSVPLYDGVMIGIDRLSLEWDQLRRNKTSIMQRIEDLTSDEKAKEVIIGKPNTAKAIR